MKLISRLGLVRVLLPSGTLLAVGGCLTDQQLTQILQSVITTGLTTAVTQFITALVSVTATGA
ncbi:MAG: hypothetical protein U1D55_17345 [Phycisphaerae bacterium]